jgi:polyhydroxyalkanoate synthesis regulator phasin
MTEKKKGRWEAGESGNPNGRPPGSSEVSKLRAAISEHLPEIIDQLVQKAKEGDAQAARLLLERVLPPIKATESTVEIDIPEEASLTEQGEAIVRAVARGLIAPGQGGTLLSGLSSVAKMREIDELTKRIEALEAGAKK